MIRPLVVFMLFLTGCASTSNVKPDDVFFVLDAPAQSSSRETSVTIKLGRVIVADYLNQPNLITKHGDHKILNARYHHWAEPLPSLIHRALKAELNAINPTTLFVSLCDSDCSELVVKVEHFYPTSDGEIVFSGFFRVGHSSTPSQFTYVSKLREDGYEQAVKQMSEQITLLANDISRYMQL